MYSYVSIQTHHLFFKLVDNFYSCFAFIHFKKAYIFVGIYYFSFLVACFEEFIKMLLCSERNAKKLMEMLINHKQR